mgnify:CR=1 FL=1
MDTQIIARIRQESFSFTHDAHNEENYTSGQMQHSQKWRVYDVLLDGHIIRSCHSYKEAFEFERKLVVDSRQIQYPNKPTNWIVF